MINKFADLVRDKRLNNAFVKYGCIFSASYPKLYAQFLFVFLQK